MRIIYLTNLRLVSKLDQRLFVHIQSECLKQPKHTQHEQLKVRRRVCMLQHLVEWYAAVNTIWIATGLVLPYITSC